MLLESLIGSRQLRSIRSKPKALTTGGLSAAMESNTQETKPNNNNDDNNEALINAFREITSSSREVALFFLESHNFDLDAAVSTFLEDTNNDVDENNNVFDVNADADAVVTHPNVPSDSASPPSEPASPDYSPTRSRSRSASPKSSRAPYELRSRREMKKKKNNRPSKSRSARGSIRSLADLNRPPRDDCGSSDDSDEPQDYYTGGEKRCIIICNGMLVQDPMKGNDVDAIFNRTRQRAVEEPADHLRPSSSSKSFTGTARLLSGGTVSSRPEPPEVVNCTIIFWRNGFCVDDGPLRRFDDPANASFLESIKESECPDELEPPANGTAVHVDLERRDENYPEPVKRHIPFQGVGRTLDSTTTPADASEPTVATTSLNSAPVPSMGLVVDESSPSTSIQLRLADGTRMVSRFNQHHTIRDIHEFIDALRPSGLRTYQLLTMGFPPKQLGDLDQTIEEAGIANSVVIQKF